LSAHVAIGGNERIGDLPPAKTQYAIYGSCRSLNFWTQCLLPAPNPVWLPCVAWKKLGNCGWRVSVFTISP